MGASKELFEQIREDIYNTTEDARDGNISLLDALLYLREVKTNAELTLDAIKRFEDENMNEISSEAMNYEGSFKGHEIRLVSGRKSFNFKGIKEIEQKEEDVKKTKKQYEIAFDGIMKGVVQTTKIEEEFKYIDENGEIKEEKREATYWIDENSELKPIPELTIGKSYIMVKEKKNKK